MDSNILSLLIAAGQTFVGALGSYFGKKLYEKYLKENTYEGPMDLWYRGIDQKVIGDGDSLAIDGLLSPYIQLFPRNPYENGKRWNTLYDFEGKITSQQYSQLEFYAGSDDTIRTGSLNGETLVGIYARYGYIGEGILGVIPTSYLLRAIPHFFNEDFFGCRVRLKGTLSHCPTQHSYIARNMFLSAGINLETDNYNDIPYIKINKIQLYSNSSQSSCSLLGSPWAATNRQKEPFIVQYGYINNKEELTRCNDKILKSPLWKNVEVFYDAIKCPSAELSFTSNFIK